MKELVYILIIGVVLLAGCASNPPLTTTTVASSTTTLLDSTTSTTRSVTSTTHASSTTQVGSSTTTTSMQAATTTQLAAVTVRISGFSFNPATLTVSKGTTVTWVNDDSVTHTVVSESGVFSSSGLGRGDSFSRTFTETGTFSYNCGPHPSMKGTIIVQ